MAELYVARKVSKFGFVHRAVIKQVKRSRPDFHHLQRMLLDEARATACFDHPNLVSIFDVGETEQGLYLALEYVEGTDLRRVNQKLRTRKEALPFELACYLAAEVLRGVHHAHTARGPDGQPLEIVHRDVNPSNVLVSTSGHVKLADFGVVRMRERIQPKTEPGLVKGKYAYLAPEYIAGEPCSVQTDVYAAGIMLFELLSGRECFTGTTAYEVMWKIVNKGVPMYRLQREGVPEDLQRLVARATSMVPERRYTSAQDMANALEAWLMRSQKHATPWVLSVFFHRHDLFQRPVDQSYQPISGSRSGSGIATPTPTRDGLTPSPDIGFGERGVSYPMQPTPDARGVVDDSLTPTPELVADAPLLPPSEKVGETRFINPQGVASPSDGNGSGFTGASYASPPNADVLPTAGPAVGHHASLPDAVTAPGAPIPPLSVDEPETPDDPVETPFDPVKKDDKPGSNLAPFPTSSPAGPVLNEPVVPAVDDRPVGSRSEHLESAALPTQPALASTWTTMPESNDLVPSTDFGAPDAASYEAAHKLPTVAPSVVDTSDLATPRTGASPVLSTDPASNEQPNGSNALGTEVRSGKLDEHPAVDILEQLSAQGSSGIIEFRCGLIWKRVLISDGKPTGVTSNMGMELIGEHLVKARIINREDLDKALQNAERLSKPLTFCLLEQGALTREALEVELGRNLAARLQEVLEWRWGTYEFTVQTMEPVEILPKLDLDELLGKARANRASQDASATQQQAPSSAEANTPQTKLKEALRVARSIAKSTGKGRVDRPWRNPKA